MVELGIQWLKWMKLRPYSDCWLFGVALDAPGAITYKVSSASFCIVVNDMSIPTDQYLHRWHSVAVVLASPPSRKVDLQFVPQRTGS